MKKTLSIVILLFSISTFSQTTKCYQISYQKIYNGNEIEKENPIICFSNEEKSYLTTEEIETRNGNFPYEVNVLNHHKKEVIKINSLSNKEKISTIDTIILNKYKFEILNEKKKILGYNCSKAKTVINSNTIEIWFTNDLKNYGGPSVLGQNLGLVLEYKRNNDFVITAKKIKKVNFEFINSDTIIRYDNLTYQDLVWKSKFETLNVFENQIINFSSESKSNDSVFRFANGTICLRKIKFPKLSAKNAIYTDLTLQSNGDAYDRTGSVFIISEDKKISFFNALKDSISVLPYFENGNNKKYQGVVITKDYEPIIELMRFFTPFGIHQYNHIELKGKEWLDQVFYRQDISDYASYLSEKEVFVGIFIGNYDKGGHKAKLNLTFHKEGLNKPNINYIIPLFNTVNVMEMAGQEYGTMFNNEKGLIAEFTLEQPIKNARLKYISTGHGGWENGDEFVPKKNTILIDDIVKHEFIPWREDCGSYRLYNPASGNFNNGLSSSDYSRSNWCPGTITNPIYIDLGNLEVGKHKIQIKIPQGEPEGSSFSAWNVSGVLIGEK